MRIYKEKQIIYSHEVVGLNEQQKVADIYVLLGSVTQPLD